MKNPTTDPNLTLFDGGAQAPADGGAQPAANGTAAQQAPSNANAEAAADRQPEADPRIAGEARRIDAARRLYAHWEQEAARVKQLYPSFDLRAELSHPETGRRFRRLMNARVDVRTAYEVVHQREIMSSIAARAVEDTANKVRNDIAARGRRPAEAGAAGTPGIRADRLDPAQLTNAQLDEISRRVMRGERITFN